MALHVHNALLQLLANHILALVSLAPRGEDNANKEKIETKVADVVSICLVHQFFTLTFQNNRENAWSGVLYFKQLEKQGKNT